MNENKCIIDSNEVTFIYSDEDRRCYICYKPLVLIMLDLARGRKDYLKLYLEKDVLKYKIINGINGSPWLNRKHCIVHPVALRDAIYKAIIDHEMDKLLRK